MQDQSKRSRVVTDSSSDLVRTQNANYELSQVYISIECGLCYSSLTGIFEELLCWLPTGNARSKQKVACRNWFVIRLGKDTKRELWIIV